MTTDTSERGFEQLICTALTGSPCDLPKTSELGEHPVTHGYGWICGDSHDDNREYCVDLVQLIAFLRDTQPGIADVVTGKLDVREAAVQLPDETDEPELPDEVSCPADNGNSPSGRNRCAPGGG